MPLTWIEHQGKKLLYIDVANLVGDYAALGTELEALVAFVQRQPRHSILALADLRNTYLGNHALLVLMSNAPLAAPHFLKSALVIETSRPRRMVLDSLGLFVGHLPRQFDDLDAAKDWLVEA